MARNLQTHAESCWTETHEWSACAAAAEVPKTEMRWGESPGEVQLDSLGFGTW